MIEGLKSVDLGPLPDDARAAVLALYQDNFGGT